MRQATEAGQHYYARLQSLCRSAWEAAFKQPKFEVERRRWRLSSRTNSPSNNHAITNRFHQHCQAQEIAGDAFDLGTLVGVPLACGRVRISNMTRRSSVMFSWKWRCCFSLQSRLNSTNSSNNSSRFWPPLFCLNQFLELFGEVGTEFIPAVQLLQLRNDGGLMDDQVGVLLLGLP